MSKPTNFGTTNEEKFFSSDDSYLNEKYSNFSFKYFEVPTDPNKKDNDDFAKTSSSSTI